jgi:hypothetical protein
MKTSIPKLHSYKRKDGIEKPQVFASPVALDAANDLMQGLRTGKYHSFIAVGIGEKGYYPMYSKANGLPHAATIGAAELLKQNLMEAW